MKGLHPLRSRPSIGAPPSRDETFETLERPAGRTRRVKTGRTEQFNVRVKAGFKQRVEDLATAEKETLGSLLESMLAAYESGAATSERGVPAAEARAGRVRPRASGLPTRCSAPSARSRPSASCRSPASWRTSLRAR